MESAAGSARGSPRKKGLSLIASRVYNRLRRLGVITRGAVYCACVGVRGGGGGWGVSVSLGCRVVDRVYRFYASRKQGSVTLGSRSLCSP